MTLPNNSDGPQAGIPSWARVGAKVVCVDASPHRSWPGIVAPPQRKVTYTIRAVRQANVSGEVGVLVEEIVNPRCPVNGVELGYLLSRFRPLVTLEDDITTYFAELLDVPAGQKVEA